MLRKSKGFTQEELAIKVNVVRQTVSKWEKGLSVPDAATLQKIAEVLDITVNELLFSFLCNVIKMPILICKVCQLIFS